MNLTFIETSSNSVLGYFREEGKVTIETYTIDHNNMKVFYTKSMNGFMLFDGTNFDGVSALVGDVVGECN